jgi:integrase/recombinase XerC
VAIKKRKKDREHRMCRVCGIAMPDFETWRGRIPVCDRKECKGSVTGYGGRASAKQIAANQIVCSTPGCNNYVPEGFFEPNVRFPVCSAKCYIHRVWGAEGLVCAEPTCGTTFNAEYGYRSYCCKDHAVRHAENQLYDERCGRFRGIFDEYIAFASLSQRSMATVRSGLSLFLFFVNQRDIEDLNAVEAPTVTAFLKWGQDTGRPAVWNAVWPVSAFMKWMIATGRRKIANPVIPSYHRRAKTKRLPRPYSEEEMRLIGSILDKRGTTVVRLAVSIAEESGLRISELANLRISDIDLNKQRLFVRLPNKAMVEAWVPFSDKVCKYLPAWIAEREVLIRDAKVKHDFLLCTEKGRPFTKGTLHTTIAQIMCKTHGGRKCNDDGLERWSTHRLRHLMATRLVAGGANAAAIMAIGRWASMSAMEGYAQVDDAVKSRGYAEAMQKAKENREKPVKSTSSFRKYMNSPSPQSKAS